MTFLPIVERELRAASRRRSTYWSRTLSGSISILICAWIFLLSSRNSPAKELGKILFYTLSVVFFGSSLLAGIRFTADALSEEKREGTLGLLFLTDLKGYDVVLGKLVASSMTSFYGLLAIFPVMAIPLLLGGVAPAEFWRMTLVLANTLLYSLAAGLFISSISRSPRKAMAGTFLVILLFNALTPAAGLGLAAFYNAKSVDDAFLIPSAACAYRLAFDNLYRTNQDTFFSSVLFTHGSTWAFLILASIAARYTWQDRPLGAGRIRLLERWSRWTGGNETERKRFRTRLLDITPSYWLGGRHRLKPLVVWVFVGLIAVVWGWCCWKWKDEWLTGGVYVLTAVILHTMLKFWVASEACRKLGDDHRSGALELVLSTPLTVSEILHGLMLSLRRQFLWPVALVVLVDLAFMLAGYRTDGVSGDQYWIWVCLVGITVFVFDLYTLGWLGLWIGVTAKRPNRAAGLTLLRILGVPWIVWFAALLFSSLVSVWNRLENSPGYLLGLWFLLSMLNDVAHFGWAHRRLHQHLRQVATERFITPRARRWLFLSASRDDSPALAQPKG